MTSIESGDRKVIFQLKQELAAAVERARALAYAIARLENRSDPELIEESIRENVMALLLQLDTSSQHNVVNFPKSEKRGLESTRPQIKEPESPSAQELILATLRDREATIRELQIVLEDHELDVTPGNLSVILSRMYQSGLIQRTGRGLYKYAG